MLRRIWIVAAASAGALPLAGPSTAVAYPAGAVALAATSLGQNPAADRRAVLSNLAKAREAMRRGRLEDAAEFISRADAIEVGFGPLYLGDTPDKARRDLERLIKRSDRKRGPDDIAAAAAEDPFAPQAPRAEAPVDPRAAAREYVLRGRQALTAGDLKQATEWYRRARDLKVDFAPEEDNPESLRQAILIRYRAGNELAGPTGPSGQPAPQSPPAGDASEPVEFDLDDALQPAAAAQEDTVANVLEARRALAAGDAARAAELVNENKAPGAAEVRRLLERRSEIVAAARAGGDRAALQEQHAAWLVDSARGLFRAGELTLAEETAGKAMKYDDPVSKPAAQALLDQIATYRGGDEVIATDQASAPQQMANTVPQAPSKADEAIALAAEAQAALENGALARADILAREALSLGVSEAAFAASENHPRLVLAEVERRRAGGVTPAAGEMQVQFPVSQAEYVPATDDTRTVLAQGELEFGFDDQPPAVGDLFEAPATPLELGEANNGKYYFDQGETALSEGDVAAARRFFEMADEAADDLDEATRRELAEHLRLLGGEPTAPQRIDPGAASSLEEVAVEQQQLAAEMQKEVLRRQTEARRMRESAPLDAYEMLNKTHREVAASGLGETAKRQLLRRLELSQRDLESYIDANRARIELDAANQKVLDEIDQQRKLRAEIENKLVALVDEFNKLMDEHRFAEAHLLAKRAQELDPNNPIVHQLLNTSNLLRRIANNQDLRDRKREGLMDAFEDVENASIPFDTRNPLEFLPATDWAALTRTRSQLNRAAERRRSPMEQRIHETLSETFRISFDGTPFRQAMKQLSETAKIPIWIDPAALDAVNVTPDMPVSLPLNEEIRLRSLLALVLEPLGLSYVIRDDVLKITDQRVQEGDVYAETYYVGDIVISIPNFLPGASGLNDAIRRGLQDASIPWGGGGPIGTAGLSPTVQLADATNYGATPGSALAQLSDPGSLAPRGPSVSPGPGGMGGGAQADFDTLIDLIVTTISPLTWEEVGGQGTIREYPTNLSLVISQTEEVHEDIKDLLDQLRRLQDLQVTIEVRFITLQEDFFERIGIDFDFDIDDNIGSQTIRTRSDAAGNFDVGDGGNSVSVGMQGTTDGNFFDTNNLPVFTSDLDFEFRQGSFASTTPIFGGFDPATAATFGFAILSDIEAFFFVQAAQGDTRTNLLQAPKVTLFNGQFATVSDQTSSPFVVSVTPVVGDFAAAQQPVIVVLPEGTSLGVQAVVSPDKRFVRMTLLPYFSEITAVDTFTFEGTTTTNTSDTTTTDADQNTVTDSTTNDQTSVGTTVQLPSLASVSVSTTVSVPDGGTILLGGVKRLREGRNERGVPIMSKIPYINRLFRNVGIGRETSSLMLMVTPRIIIPEEEESELLGENQ